MTAPTTPAPETTPFLTLSPFDFAASYMSSLAFCAPAFSRQAALMAHRQELARQAALSAAATA